MVKFKRSFSYTKKERIEQMKEHEREADRGYREELEKEEKEEHHMIDIDLIDMEGTNLRNVGIEDVDENLQNPSIFEQKIKE